MIESGYYKNFEGQIYYVICEAIKANQDNTQQRYVVYKPIDLDTIFTCSIEEFNELIELGEERIKRFKKLDNYIPYIPPTIYPYIPYQPSYSFWPITCQV